MKMFQFQVWKSQKQNYYTYNILSTYNHNTVLAEHPHILKKKEILLYLILWFYLQLKISTCTPALTDITELGYHIGFCSQVSFIYIAQYHKTPICLTGLYNLYNVQHLLSLDPLFRSGKTPQKTLQQGEDRRNLMMSNEGGIPLPGLTDRKQMSYVQNRPPKHF